MKKNREKLNDQEKTLLEITAGDLIPQLRENKKLIHVKQMAYGYYDKETKEEWQVQVLITRSVPDFLEFLEVEEMSSFAE